MLSTLKRTSPMERVAMAAINATRVTDTMRENERLHALLGDNIPQDLWSEERIAREVARQETGQQ